MNVIKCWLCSGTFCHGCAHLDRSRPNRFHQDPRIFRSILLNTCQQNFEKYCSEPDFQLSKEGDAPLPVEQTSGLEKSAFEIETEYKKCMSGTVKFVAKLIVEEILASKMVVLLAESLLENEHPVRLENLAV